MKKGITKSSRFLNKKMHNLDVKFAYHVVRLLNEAEQILTTGDLDLRKNNEHLKAIRRGDVSEQEIREYFSTKEKQLEELYLKSPLPYGPDEDKIKELLFNCLEHHYGSLENCVVMQDNEKKCIAELQEVLSRYGY